MQKTTVLSFKELKARISLEHVLRHYNLFDTPPIFAGRISTYFKGLGTDQANSTPSAI